MKDNIYSLNLLSLEWYSTSKWIDVLNFEVNDNYYPLLHLSYVYNTFTLKFLFFIKIQFDL